MGIPVGQNIGVSGSLFGGIDQSGLSPIPMGGPFTLDGKLLEFNVQTDFFFFHEFQNQPDTTIEQPFEQNIATNVRYYGRFAGWLLPGVNAGTSNGMSYLSQLGMQGTGQGTLAFTFIDNSGLPEASTETYPTITGTAWIWAVKITKSVYELDPHKADRPWVEFMFRYNGRVFTEN